MQLSRGVLVASIQVDLHDGVLARFREELLGRLHHTGATGVILDVSGLRILDSAEFAALRRIMDMTRLMGAESVLVGLRPGVVSALIAMGADVDGVQAAIDQDAAFARLEPEPASQSQSQSDPELESQSGSDPDDQASRETAPAAETAR